MILDKLIDGELHWYNSKLKMWIAYTRKELAEMLIARGMKVDY